MSNSETPSLPEILQQPKTESSHPHRRRRRRSHRFRWFRRIRRSLKRFNWRVSVILLVAVTSVLLMSAAVLTFNARNNVYDSWSTLSRVWNNLNNTPGTELTLIDFERLQSTVGDLSTALAGARSQISFVRPLASLNNDVEVYFYSLDAAQELTLAAGDLLDGLEPTLFFLTGGEEGEIVAPQFSSGERTVELLRLGRGRFLSAQQHLDLAKEKIDKMDLANVSENLLVTVDGLVKYHQQMVDINNALLDAPALLTEALGLEETKTYLILSQNNDELRPSGGYISTYGWMTVRNGRVMDYSYYPSTASSPNPPPRSMGEHVDVPDWWLPFNEPVYAAWDASWYADFPSTAEMAAWYYNNGGNPQSPVDGVIAIDIVGFEYVLEELGDVYVSDYDQMVQPGEFREEIYRIRAAPGDAHKRFLASLYRQILTDWQAVDQQTSVDLRGAVLRALQEKHVMIYFTNPELNDAIALLHWSGAQDQGRSNDYLMVADANLGNKSNRSVIRQITYDVEIMPDGSLESRAAINYDYPERIALEDPAVAPAHYSNINYNNLMQVFVPGDSVLTGTNNLLFEPSVDISGAHTVFASLVIVRYNESERFVYSYTTPVLVEAFGPYRRYELKLEKQAGTLNEAVNVQVTLPQGASTVFVSPSPDASYRLEQPILEFRVDLKTDKTIEIVYTQ